MEKITTSVIFDKEIKKKIEELAIENRRSLSSQVMIMLQKQLKKEK